MAHCRSLRAELGTARGHFESRRGTGLGRQKKLRQMRVGGHSFSARLAFSRPVLSPSLSPRPSSCLISALLSGFLCFISPLPSLLALSGPLSCSAVFLSCPHLPPLARSISVSAYFRNTWCGTWRVEAGCPEPLGVTRQLLQAPVSVSLLQSPSLPLPVTGEWGL